MKIKGPKEFWAGLMFIVFGLGFLAIALGPPAFLVSTFKEFGWKLEYGYQMGTAVRMGPAYFPTMLGGLLSVIGLAVLVDSFAENGPKVPPFLFRPMFFVVIGCLCFAYILKPAGLVISIFAIVLICAFGGHEFKLKEVLILASVLAVFSVFVFVKGLTLPFPIWPDPSEIRRSLGIANPPVVETVAPAPAPKK